MSDERYETLRRLIRDVPDFPKPGILLKDITPLLGDPAGLRLALELFEERVDLKNIDLIAGMESRGFILGAALAARTGLGFVPVRKPGKLPADKHRVEYELEYGTDALEIHKDAVPAGSRVLIIDDLIATGGTAKATGELIHRCEAQIASFAFMINLTFLNGTDKLTPHPVVSLLEY